MLQKILIFQQLVWAFYIIILIIQQNYFSDLYPAKILDLPAKPFFPCTVQYVILICTVKYLNSLFAK